MQSNVTQLRPAPEPRQPSAAFLGALQDLDDAVAMPRDQFTENQAKQLLAGLQTIALAIINLQYAGRFAEVRELTALVNHGNLIAQRITKGDAA